MKLSESVILPREDFIELQTAAWDQKPISVKEQAKSVVQTYVVFAGLAAFSTAGIWGWAKIMDWKEERALARTLHDQEFKLSQLYPK